MFLKNFHHLKLLNHKLIVQLVKRSISTIESNELSKVRNIGIIAHVDAGKTTTTERMLYYSGLTENIGDVDKGNTITDYMVQERERGITITSSPVQFKWNKHFINLIDTPGHVDFNYEVERCLTVLDGSVVLLDASAGVEPQTIQVWRQSNNFEIPKLIYLNKMDKPRANYEKCLNDISKFKTNHILLQLPLFDQNKKFIGVIDLINLEKNIWNLKEDSSGIVVANHKLNAEDKEFKLAITLKENLIGKLCEFDNELAEQIFKIDNVLELPDQLIVNSIRKSTVQNQAIPVLMGSSFKNIGIQLLMNAITRYLPSPLEKNFQISKIVNGCTSGFLFKIKYDKRLGALYFIRIYDGELKSNSKLYNFSKNKEEKILKLFKVFANEYTEIKSAKRGDIVAVTGLQHSSNGDFFVLNRETFNKVENYLNKSINLSKSEEIILKGLKFPDPVIFCSIEAESTSKEIELENALKCLQQEDPSFSVIFNKETNQSILRGMGDLHLQIIKDRLKRDFKLNPYFGNLQIAYLESFRGSIFHELQFNKVVRDINNTVFIKLKINQLDKAFHYNHESINKKRKALEVIQSDENELYRLRFQHLKCIERGIDLALESGPLLGNKVVNVNFELHDFKTTSKTLETMITSATYECIKQAFEKDLNNFYLLEPVMSMKIEFLEENYSTIIKEISNRRAIIGEHKIDDYHQTLDVLIPFAETINLSNKLRSITSGNANYTMQINNYLPVNRSDQDKIIDEMKFGSSLN